MLFIIKLKNKCRKEAQNGHQKYFYYYKGTKLLKIVKRKPNCIKYG